MKLSNRRLLTAVVVITVGVAVGAGYAVDSLLFSGEESKYAKSQFITSELKREEDPDVSEDDLSKLVEANNEFALDLYHKIDNGDGNLFYSPYSISLALAMTYAGAEGQTEQQMAGTLNFSLPEKKLHRAFNYLDQSLSDRNDENFTLNVSNSFWSQKNYHFEEEYLDTLAVNYGAGIRVLDFLNEPDLSRETINKWVENETENKIKDLLPKGAVTSKTRAVITNAIYFNAFWKLPFEESATEFRNFTLLNGKEKDVEMMSQTEEFKYAQDTDYKAVELPYQGKSNMSMLVILPNRTQFEEFENKLNIELLEDIIAKLEPRGVSLKIPKFEYEAKLDLKEILKEMGMPSAFSSSANFSGMTGDESLFISKFLHKAFVSVDEKGTEAAAATAVGFEEEAVTPQVEMNIDSPFIFLIRDNETGTILFAGRVTNPRV